MVRQNWSGWVVEEARLEDASGVNGSGEPLMRCAVVCPLCGEKTRTSAEWVHKAKGNVCQQHLGNSPECLAKHNEANASPLVLKDKKASTVKAKYERIFAKSADTVTIYKLVYIPEERDVYTGRTKDPERRLGQHASKNSKCRLVRNGFRKHGRKSYRLDVLMRCNEADAVANESAWIIRNNTMYPNGYNLVHGSVAGEDRDGKELVPSFTGVVPFTGVADEVAATSEAWGDLASVLADLEGSTDTDS
eukprot:1169525-Prymnesium_polylepis.1